jgi:hypothetical protein
MASFVGGISRFALALELASAGCRSGSSADTAAVNARLAEPSRDRGRFRIEWARGRDGRWLIHRMGAISR